MMTLTPRVKESIKTALAMTIAYGIALSMDWDRPYWAGFAVTFISLSTVGQSLNKGAMRMLGTLLALVVSLIIIALFVQERWWFMVALAGWYGFCTYRMTVSRRSYFWFLAGFASVIISFDGGTDPINAFDTAMVRAQETALGVLVYTLVTTLLWPSSSRPGFEAATRTLARVQHRLYSGYREAMANGGRGPAKPDQGADSGPASGADSGPDLRAIATEHDQSLAQFSASLDAVLTDSNAVWELRRQWRDFQRQSGALRETLERWHQNSEEFADLDLDRLLPTLATATAEIDQRFTEIERLLAGEAPRHQAQAIEPAIELPIDPSQARGLSHFHQAALALARDGLQRLDRLTRSQLDTVRDIQGLGPVSAPPNRPAEVQSAAATAATESWSGPLPDPDSLIAAIRAMASLWLAYLLWIYLEVPGGTGIVSMVGPLGMIFATTPRLPPLKILVPMLLAIGFGGGMYVFVMPQLSSFAGLGTMIFVTAFAISYRFSTPRQGIARSIALAIFLTLIGVSNQQHYNFLSIADTVVMFFMAIGLLTLVSRAPFSMQPDKAFLRLLARFFRSSEYLMTTMQWQRTVTPTRLDYWRRAFHARQVATLPQQLADWGKVIDTRALPGTSAAQLQAVIARVQALSFRMRELLDARADPQAALLVRELLTDLRTWRLGVQGALQGFSKDPAAAPEDHLRERLTAKLEQLEGRIEKTLNKAGKGEISAQDGESFYRLLGAYRALSDAVVEYAGSAQGIDWKQWRESRF